MIVKGKGVCFSFKITNALFVIFKLRLRKLSPRDNELSSGDNEFSSGDNEFSSRENEFSLRKNLKK